MGSSNERGDEGFGEKSDMDTGEITSRKENRLMQMGVHCET